MPRPLPRNALRAGATALAAGLLTLGAPSVGQATETAQTLEFTDSQYGKPLQVKPYDDPAYDFISVRNTGSQPLTDFTLTFDATALKGQLTLSVDSPCVEKQDLVFVCDGVKLNGNRPLQPGESVSRGLHFKTLATSQPGFTGEVRASGAAGSTSLGDATFQAGVADAGPLLDRSSPSSTWSKPGKTLHPSIGFTNYSRRPLKGVYVGIQLTQGLSVPEEFSNCEYGHFANRDTGIRCYIETPVTAGGSYDLDELALKVGSTAADEIWNVGVYETTDGYLYKNQKLTGVHRGTGRAMRLVARAGGPGTFDMDNGTGRVIVENSFDLQALGATVHGKAGQVVQAKLGVRNNGPASIDQYDRSDGPADGPSSVTHVTVPRGTTAVKVPQLCRSDDDWKQGKPGARHYSCFQDVHDWYFDAGQVTPFVFGLRIDRPADLAPGSIKVTMSSPDSNTKNNTAPIKVTADGTKGHGSASSSGGSSTTGGSSASGGTAASGGTSGSATTGSGTTGSGTAAAGGTAQGSMADTGTGALPWYAAAAAAVALITGGTLFVVARRRKN
ncbi:hypothetical protein [Streptomyces sp. NPDC127190]|uniref:hypothetical protein n=1 Tax=unclassified Streptomyces TaxID=2593676 RepID=UPI003641F09A